MLAVDTSFLVKCKVEDDVVVDDEPPGLSPTLERVARAPTKK